MRQPIVLCSSLLVALAFASSASAVTLYAAPDGTSTSGCYYDIPCSLDGATKLAVPGDTVVLKDGVYASQGIYPPANTQGASPAWITFQADECATPILEGPGAGPLDDVQESGVFADKATYLRFVGIVTRGWSSGFSNGYTGDKSPTPPSSNGHWEFKNCIADRNGRTGFTFFAAEGIHLENSIAAHNGSSVKHSWSSGVTLLYASGTGNLIEGNVSFENMDNHDQDLDMHTDATPPAPGRHSDGNGFIADENTNGATFINNIAFGNGGSCLRMTRSNNTRFINNTCYHNARDTRDAGPSNPGEVYFTDAQSKMGVAFMNNVFWATGNGPGATAIYGKPTTGWMNNVEANSGTPPLTSADGANPDFTVPATATTLIGKGMPDATLTKDIGFDPKCIVKKVPDKIGMMDAGSWWEYSIDYDYIKSIGGVAKCFNPGARSGNPDIGAYKTGALTTSPVTQCTPTIPPDHAGPPGGTAGAGGGASVGGAPATAGMTSTPGGSSTSGGAASAGGSSVAAGTASAAGGSAVGNGTAGSSAGNTAGSSGATPSGAVDSGGCGCHIGQEPSRSNLLLALSALGALVLGLRRRRQSRS